MHHSDFIRHLASFYRPNIYLELGLYDGETFNKVAPFAIRKIGVDIKPTHIQGELFVETTDKFFEHFTEEVDMIFIDADHSYSSVLKDFENSLKILKPNGIILLHDTDPETDTLFDFGYCGDAYRIVPYLESRLDLNITTFPITEAGLSLVTRKNSTRVSLRHGK